MSRPEFGQLKLRLLKAGISPRNVDRAVRELGDHYDDLEAEGLSYGLSPQDAGALALQRLGRQSDIADRMSNCRELKSWVYRYPSLARLVLPIAYVAMAPIAHVPAGIEVATVIMRWGTCLILSAAVTSLMLLIMQLSISLT